MSDAVVDHLTIDGQLEGEKSMQRALCSLDDSVLNGESEEEDPPLDIPQLCLKAELATVLADQVEVLRERNLVLGQAVISGIIYDCL